MTSLPSHLLLLVLFLGGCTSTPDPAGRTEATSPDEREFLKLVDLAAGGTDTVCSLQAVSRAFDVPIGPPAEDRTQQSWQRWESLTPRSDSPWWRIAYKRSVQSSSAVCELTFTAYRFHFCQFGVARMEALAGKQASTVHTSHPPPGYVPPRTFDFKQRVPTSTSSLMVNSEPCVETMRIFARRD